MENPKVEIDLITMRGLVRVLDSLITVTAEPIPLVKTLANIPFLSNREETAIMSFYLRSQQLFREYQLYDCDNCGTPTPREYTRNVNSPHGEGRFCESCLMPPR